MAFVIDDFEEELGEEELGDEELGDEELGDEELGEDELGEDELGEEVSELDMLIRQTVSNFFDRKLKWISFYL
jgi:hypothetical protein